MIDHCISRLNLEAENQLYRTYITDSIKFISEGIVRIVGGNKVSIQRYTDILNNAKAKTSVNADEEKDADEIISNIKNRLNTIGGGKKE